jgi:condensin complex subunit 1
VSCVSFYIVCTDNLIRVKREDEDEMEVDDEDAEPTVKSEHEGEDAEMDDGTSSAPSSPHKKKKKGKKPRKSEIDMAALTDEQAALAALESDQLLHLRLRRKYYAEALNFIKQIEGSMEILGKLLGSTHKLEVLEAMEFFRVAYEYQFDSAEVGVQVGLRSYYEVDTCP